MELRVPGDKSISHRALLFASLTEETSRIRGVLPGEDPMTTARILSQLGAAVPHLPPDGAEILVRGLGRRGLVAPADELDCGNSGTTARLLLGILAGQDGCFTLTGDSSLRRRPMARVTEPLALMGGRFEAQGEPGLLPLTVIGGPMGSLDYELPVASAQVKSALLLAGVVGGQRVTLTEPGRSRDHTERLLGGMGCIIESCPAGEGWQVSLRNPPAGLDALDLTVPGDVSSAAFLLALCLLGGGPRELTIVDVGLNPTRTGILPVFRSMGADIDEHPTSASNMGEPLGALTVRRSQLRGVELTAQALPTLIDEVPILAVAAARAEGETRITGAGELRVKESDRIAALVSNLRAVGVAAHELEDGLVVEGTDAPLTGTVSAFMDHRIAMAFGVLGALPGNEIVVQGREVVDVSFPGFWELLQVLSSERGSGTITGNVGESRREPDEAALVAPTPAGSSPPGEIPDLPALVITLDGPAGSGKSSTASAVARRLQFRHLDSGALYRALTVALLRSEVAVAQWPALSADELAAFPLRIEPTGTTFSIWLGEEELVRQLRTPRVTEHVSIVASIPAVREWLLDAQREAGRKGRLVADGRDMGTVVFPDAKLKIFLVADLPERARRRLIERDERPDDSDALAREQALIEERDRQDSERTLSPLRMPHDAVALDTTGLTFEEQVEAVLDLAKSLTDKD